MLIENYMNSARSSNRADPTADKLRALAAGIQSQIDDKLGDRQTNTPKRLAQANHARVEGLRLQRTQQAMEKLAVLYDAGRVPDALKGVKTKRGIYELCGAKLEYVSNGYHGYHHDTGKPAKDTAESKAIWALLEGRSNTEIEADAIQRLIEGVQFLKIPGYFPTPEPVSKLLFSLLPVSFNPAGIMEPSMGSGDLADFARNAWPLAGIWGYERNITLAKISKHKGYDCERGDFLQQEPNINLMADLVLMNPPFEGGQDIDHVLHGFRYVRRGGYLLAIVSPGSLYRSQRKYTHFQEWISNNHGHTAALPAGSFKASGTGVDAAMLMVYKP